VLEGEFPTIEGDEVMLRQAFSNLLRNALEACAAALVAPHVRIEGQVDRAQRQARIAISDNGPGIDRAIRDRIFRPFVTSKGHGTGLGLALVQKIVVTHNGRISASRGAEGGACFQVILPLPGPADSTSVT
jgi:signal transduction histidine kinase